MYEQFAREIRLIGEENFRKITKLNIAIFGIGGVGSFVAEGLARAGVGSFLLVDDDVVDITNINRQIHANMNTVGRLKVEVMKERILSINPQTQIETSTEFFMPGSKILQERVEQIDYIVDAIDTVKGKIELICQADKLNIPIISAMGTGNKLDPTKFEICDIYKTSVCPLARAVRKELKRRGIKRLKVVYSKEEPIKQKEEKVPASISFVPSVAGLLIASEIIKDIIK